MERKDTNTYTMMTPCVPVGRQAPACPSGWSSSGFTSPGQCIIGGSALDGPSDSWRGFGYQRVCKRTVPTSGDLAVDCCSNLYGIAGSIECKQHQFNPYSWKCNTVMSDRCNTNVGKDPYAASFDGSPLSEHTSAVQTCGGSVRGPYPAKQPGSLGAPNCVSTNSCGKTTVGGKTDEHCINYLRNAPSNNFFSNHDFSDVPRYFPRYSYVTPAFYTEWGYSPMRKPYYAYNDYKQKYQNNYCRQFPEQCNYGRANNDYHY
jgi:hypothetical protein